MRWGEIGALAFSNWLNDSNGIDGSSFVFLRSSKWWNLRYGSKRDTSLFPMEARGLLSTDSNILRQIDSGKQIPLKGDSFSAQFSGSKTYLESRSLTMGLNCRSGCKFVENRCSLLLKSPMTLLKCAISIEWKHHAEPYTRKRKGKKIKWDEDCGKIVNRPSNQAIDWRIVWLHLSACFPSLGQLALIDREMKDG